MLFLSQPSHLFGCIILIIGILTTSTDLWQKKIYNIHLILGAGLGLMAVCYTLLIDPKIIISHLTNGGLAFLIGWLLYHFKLWRGGDAKLFFLYAFLMPLAGPGTALFSSALRLFACSFIIAMIIIMPFFIRDIISNHTMITYNIWLRREAIFQGVMATVFYSWIVFPVFYIAKITNPVIILTVSYLIFLWGYDASESEAKEHYIINFLKKKYIEMCIAIPFGFLIRLWLVPDSLAWPVLVRSILTIGISTLLSACIHTALKHLKDYRDRVPFAPLLFIGCILSYTPFLTRIMYLINLTRR
jgi:hypothetical protein